MSAAAMTADGVARTLARLTAPGMLLLRAIPDGERLSESRTPDDDKTPAAFSLADE